MVTNYLQAPHGVYFTLNRTILRSAYGARPGIDRCYHIQTPTGARTICEYEREKS